MSKQTPTLVLHVQQNATFERALRWTTTVDGSKRPVNIVGWSALLQVRDHHEGTVLFEASTMNGRIRIDGPNGRIILRFDAKGGTENMRFREGIWDLILRSPVGTVRRMVQGKIIVEPGVSRFV